MNNSTCSYFTCARAETSNLSAELHLGTELVFGRHGFIKAMPWAAVPAVLVLIAASVSGTFGNVLILVAIIAGKCQLGMERVLLINLAASDLFLTAIVDPLSIVAKLEGEHFFDGVPGLCRTIASMCTISCVASLLTISSISINRYFYICKRAYHPRIFTKRNNLLICVLTYVVGTLLVFLNLAGVGNHGFDRKSLDCTLDRMATFTYTVVFAIVMVIIPSILTGFCYLLICLHVHKHSRTVQPVGHSRNGFIYNRRTLQLARTLCFIYAVFVLCWVPYAILIVADTHDTFPHGVHVYVSVWAHLHPSINWIIYYVANKNFAIAFRRIWRLMQD